MAFDGNPENFQTTKPDVFSLAGLIAWLETQNPATEYKFFAIRDCLISRYCRAREHTYRPVGASPDDFKLFDATGRASSIAHTFEIIAVRSPHTYGAALERAHAAVAA